MGHQRWVAWSSLYYFLQQLFGPPASGSVRQTTKASTHTYTYINMYTRIQPQLHRARRDTTSSSAALSAYSPDLGVKGSTHHHLVLSPFSIYVSWAAFFWSEFLIVLHIKSLIIDIAALYYLAAISECYIIALLCLYSRLVQKYPWYLLRTTSTFF